jgi:hypothetical protein
MGSLFGGKKKKAQGPTGAHAWIANEQARKQEAESVKAKQAELAEKTMLRTRR